MTDLQAFTKTSSAPKTTFSLVLAAVTVAVLAMWMDAVPRYSQSAFFAGLLLTIALAAALGLVVDRLKGPRGRLAATILLPTAFGGLIGMVVQTIVMKDAGNGVADAVKDLGGLVDTTDAVPWIASGIVLGGVPAMLVSLFLTLANRFIRRVTGHDASEGFGVAFTGFAGLLAAFGLVVVEGIAVPPLFIVAIASSLTVMLALLVDGSRIRFLRRVYAGQGQGFDIVPADRFSADPSLAPMVAKAGSTSILVKIDTRGSYRGAAAEPIAFVAETQEETLRPLLRRRTAAAAILGAMLVLGALAAAAHA